MKHPSPQESTVGKAEGLNSTQQVVATAFPEATRAGIAMLRQGGNAVDAALAAAWALSVCEPAGSGLGGQTSLLVHCPDGRVLHISGHSYAPQSASRKKIDSAEQRYGRKASTIPSTPAVLEAAGQLLGRLSLREVMSPAVALADEGFPVTRLFRRQIQWVRDSLAQSPAAIDVFFSQGRLVKRGAVLRQPLLASTLRHLADYGAQDFYHGEMARDIAEDMERNGGLITATDLAGFSVAKPGTPFSASYRGHRVVSVGPPAGGPQLCLGLKILENYDMSDCSLDTWYITQARIAQLVFSERERLAIRADEMPPSFHNWLVGEDRARELYETLQTEDRPALVVSAEGSGETTHLCAADGNGMVVSLTQSLQSLFGAKVMHPKLGFFYNNYLSTCPRTTHPNRLRSRAVPQTNASPTMVFDADAPPGTPPRIVLGAAGSRRITSSLLQVLSHMLDRGDSLQAAIKAPRIHATVSGKVMLEKSLAQASLLDRLPRYFVRHEVKAKRSFAMGCVQALCRSNANEWSGMADPRREGDALGC